MIRALESLTLFTGNATRLAKFYQAKVGLKVTLQGEIGEQNDKVYQVGVGEGSGLYIVDHSGVKGQNKEPSRIIFNLEVDKIEPEVKKLKIKKVKLIQDIYHVEGYGLIATFEDVDGNYFQLVQVKPS